MYDSKCYFCSVNTFLFLLNSINTKQSRKEINAFYLIILKRYQKLSEMICAKLCFIYIILISLRIKCCGLLNKTLCSQCRTKWTTTQSRSVHTFLSYILLEIKFFVQILLAFAHENIAKDIFKLCHCVLCSVIWSLDI